MEWLNPHALAFIATAFPSLEELSFRQEHIWCPLCNTCTVSAFKDPIPDAIVYESGIGLSVR